MSKGVARCLENSNLYPIAKPPAKQEHKMQEKALKREKNLEMLKPSGELMSSKVALFKEALQLEGDPSEWSSEVLATKLDAGTGRRLCEEAFAAKREEREARSLMISAKESAEILRRFGAGARKSEKKKKVREPFLATVEKVKAQSEESRKPRVAGAYSSPPPLVKMESSGSKKRVFIDLLSDSDDDRRAHKKKAKVEGVSSKEQVNVEEAAPTDEACSVCFHPQSIDEEFTPELATALQPASIKLTWSLALASALACSSASATSLCRSSPPGSERLLRPKNIASIIFVNSQPRTHSHNTTPIILRLCISLLRDRDITTLPPHSTAFSY
eukprot:g58193.t1